MSSSPLDMPILISQLPNLQQAMGTQYVPAEAQQALFGQLVADNQRKEEQNVQVVEKEDGLNAMGRDSGGNKEGGQQPTQQQRTARKHLQTTDDTLGDTQSSNASPWAGNIINVKI